MRLRSPPRRDVRLDLGAVVAMLALSMVPAGCSTAKAPAPPVSAPPSTPARQRPRLSLDTADVPRELPRFGSPRMSPVACGHGAAATCDPGSLSWVMDSIGSPSCRAVAATDDGGFVLTGSFGGAAPWGKSNLRQMAPLMAEVFLARFHADATLAWQRWAGGGGTEQGTAVQLAADGSVLLSGQLGSETVFGHGETREARIRDAAWQTFAARYTADGAFAWARPVGWGSEQRRAFAVRPDGGILLAENVDRVPGATGRSRWRDASVASYAADGTPAWTRTLQGPHRSNAMAVAALSDGGAVLVGTFLSRPLFGAGEPGEVSLEGTPGSTANLFIARYGAGGELAWARQARGLGNVYPMALVALTDDGVLLTGHLEGEVIFDSVDGGTHTLASTPEPQEGPLPVGALVPPIRASKDFFLARFDAKGALRWAHQARAVSFSSGRALAVLADAGAIVTGVFRDRITFEGGVELSSSAPGMFDVLIARFGPNGSLRWARQGGSAHEDAAPAVAVLADGSALLVGSLRGDATLFNGHPTAMTVGAPDADRCYVASVAP